MVTMLLTGRKLLLEKLRDVDNDLRGILRNFGLKVGAVSPGRFEARVRELVSDAPRLRAIVSPILAARAALAAQYTVLHKMVLDLAKDDVICRRLMIVPGVGPVVAMTFCAIVDQPSRFAKSKAVGAHFGLTPRHYQSGEMDYNGRTSKCGDRMIRAALYEAAQALLTCMQKWFGAQSLGRSGRQEPRPWQGDRRGRAQACRHHASDLAGRLDIPLDT